MKAFRWTVLVLAMVVGVASQAEEQRERSRTAIAQAVLVDVEQRFEALPWTQSINGEFSKLGAYAMHAFPGYSWAVLKRAVDTDVKQPPFLLGDSLLQQVQFLYLHSPNEFEQKLKLVTAPRGELWKSSPVDTVKFARAVSGYTDATADDVM